VHIERDDLSRPEIAELLKEHLASMFVYSPPESVHALPIEGLRSPDITFWSVWENDELLGCGALKELDPRHGEIKSMRTASAHVRKGVARAMLYHIIAEAKRRGYRRLSLETGSMAAFEPARQLYTACGFTYCEPFGDYVNDPNSVFMTLELDRAAKSTIRPIVIVPLRTIRLFSAGSREASSVLTSAPRQLFSNFL